MSAKRVSPASLAPFFESARLAQALTIASIGLAVFSFLLKRLIGWPGVIAVLIALIVLCALSFAARRPAIEWRGVLTISLLLFLAWCAASVFWSEYQWVTLGAVVYQVGFSILGLYIAITRDLIQTIRAFGDVLRVALWVSLGIEVFSGLLIDTPISFLDIQGSLIDGGPIQGVFGSRNQLGTIVLLAIVTFIVEWFTRSVGRTLSLTSFTAAALTVLFTGSPVVWGTLLVVGAASLALFFIRRAGPAQRRAINVGLVVFLAVSAITTFAVRARIIDALNAGSEFEARYILWRQIVDLSALDPLTGFGWSGFWRTDLAPFVALAPNESALNAFVDVYFQVGLIGLMSFIVLLGLAFVRSWLIAANQRSVTSIWPALILVVLGVTAFAESSILVEFGWLTLVVCAVRASHVHSWRLSLPEPPAERTP